MRGIAGVENPGLSDRFSTLASPSPQPLSPGRQDPEADSVLQAGGETLSLLPPSTNSTSQAIAKVRYSALPPWPAGANGLGSSLQLIDPAQDNWRVGNWSGSFPPAAFSPGNSNSVKTSLPPFPSLWLNEVQPENLTGVTNSAGQQTPWLEIFNPSSNIVSLSGLYLATNYTNLLAWQFPPAATVAPGQFKIVFMDGLTNLSTFSELHAGLLLSPNTGSVALSRIFNGQPQVLDYLDYLGLPPDHSYGSVPDGQSFDRRDLFYPTPGAANNGASAPLTVTINEWMAGNTHTIANPLSGKFSDWFELYNYGSNTANLSGFYLTDALTNKFQFQIPAGYLIPPHGFLLVWADGRSTNGTPDLHVTFKMNKAGESLGLFGADGQTVDFVTYGAQSDDISQGRYPDGTSTIRAMPTPTPRTNNVVPNTAPSIGPLSVRFVTIGQMLSFTATASDTDMPAQTLTWSLDPGAPTGASINANSGLFSWTPSTAPSSNSITLIVTDNGSPPLSASRAFSVIVLVPPSFSGARVDRTKLYISWNGVIGQTCQLEYSASLNPANWSSIANPFVGNGTSVLFTNDLSFSTQGFYRLRVIP